MNNQASPINRYDIERSLSNTASGQESSIPSSPASGPRRSYSERLPGRRLNSSAHVGRDHDLPPLPPDPSLNSSEESISVPDRKRRLTATTETGRRRTTTGGFTSRDNHYHHTPRRNSRTDSTMAMAEREVIDLTGSSPVRSSADCPTRPLHRHRTPSNTSRGYVVPRWQADNEANECPICGRPFSFLFRRHHCRKCGRVVCNECSPHRITIPRQYIVHPPGSLDEPLPSSDIPTIDLTSGDDDGLGFSRRNSALGGGEKVRLCNPCVPDPQPELLDMLREGPSTTFPIIPTRQGSITRRDIPGSYPTSVGSAHLGQRYYGQVPHPGTRVNISRSGVEEDSDSTVDVFARSLNRPTVRFKPILIVQADNCRDNHIMVRHT